jgi:hypothetical protein
MLSLTPASTHVRLFAKMGQTALPNLAHCTVVETTGYQLSGPVNNALHDCHFIYDSELKQSFCYVIQS